ncbi:MAG: haloacid dehalogenase type II [Coleofasciculaceae cyanobacterium]
MINFEEFEILSFDCYGTLVDWESGILNALKPILSNHNINISDQEILELFASLESKQESGNYLNYREILKNVVQDFGKELNFEPTEIEVNALPDSIQNWEPFPDTVQALKALKKRYKLTIISNIDDELFAHTAKKLAVEFDWVITAEQVKSYKPSLQNFQVALQRMGIAGNRLLHVAQSIYHDIVPAKTMGLATVWVNRRKNQEGFGATVPANETPDVEVPDLKSLVSRMGLD